jgi:glycosyltransferase involved in cell wall biosynthesis
MKEILCLTTYPPRECGIATFSADLLQAIDQKFGLSYSLKVCALESQSEKHVYSDTVKYKLNTSDAADYVRIVEQINTDAEIALVLIEHEFGLFAEQETAFLQFLQAVNKPIIIVFHTVLPHPQSARKEYLRQMIAACSSVIVMTQISSAILQEEYEVEASKIQMIPHGTHLVSHSDKKTLKEKYKVSGRPVLATFGLLSPGKSIETTLDALPAILEKHPTAIFLIIGKTHPTILKTDGEQYREMLQQKISDLGVSHAVRFVNLYLDLPILLEYLQLTDIYLFTSSDPNQAVSGTFVYAMSCGCPIIATPIPHALELLKDNSGIIFDFKNSAQLSLAANRLLSNENLRSKMRSTKTLRKRHSTFYWEKFSRKSRLKSSPIRVGCPRKQKITLSANSP